GELEGPMAHPIGQADHLQELLDARIALPWLFRDETRWYLDVLGRGQEREQAERLEDEADGRSPEADELCLRHLADRHAGDVGGATGRQIERAEQREQRVLA